MLIAIDGTGPYDKDQYESDMKWSFCNQLCMGSAMKGVSYYIPGPGGFGGTGSFKVTEGLQVIGQYYFERAMGMIEYPPPPRPAPVIGPIANRITLPLFLAGYSRGGCYALELARSLMDFELYIAGTYCTVQPGQRAGIMQRLVNPDTFCAHFCIDVEALFLFDPVNRDPFISDEVGIPPNVKKAYLIYRDETIEDVADGTPMGDKYARKWMGHANTSTIGPPKVIGSVVGTALNRTQLIKVTIGQASHAAAGGAPWTERPLDEPATNNAANWMNQWLKANNIPVVLCNMYPFPRAPQLLTFNAVSGQNVYASGSARTFGQAYDPASNNLYVPFNFQPPTASGWSLTLAQIQTATLEIQFFSALTPDAFPFLVKLGDGGSNSGGIEFDASSQSGRTASMVLYDASNSGPGSWSSYNAVYLSAFLQGNLKGAVNSTFNVDGVQLIIKANAPAPQKPHP